MDNNDQSKRIIVVAPTPFFADRGCHVRILEEVRALIPLGYQITICTYHIGRDIKGIETRRIIRIPWYCKLSAGPSVHKLYLDLFLLWTVIRSCLKERPDIIHAHLHEGVVIGKIVSRLFDVPLVADLQGSLTGELLDHHFIKQGGFLHQIFQWVERVISRMPDVTLISSSKIRSFLPNEVSGTVNKIEVIPDGVDTERFQPGCPVDGIRERLCIPHGIKVVGFLGVLTDYQGVTVFLEAIPYIIETMKEVHFLIMGYPNVEHYIGKAKAIGIEAYVTFTGRIPYEDAPRYLAICDVAVSPKLLSTEANGKLLNYMAMGLPIVASDTPVNREILGELGVYANVGDPVSLAMALLKVLSDDVYAKDLGTRLREKAMSEYSWQSAGKKISEFYTRLTRDDYFKPKKRQGVLRRIA